MATLGLMLAAVLIALLIGLPLGILAGRSERVTAVLSPILDVMQIMPTLVVPDPGHRCSSSSGRRRRRSRR